MVCLRYCGVSIRLSEIGRFEKSGNGLLLEGGVPEMLNVAMSYYTLKAGGCSARKRLCMDVD